MKSNTQFFTILLLVFVSVSTIKAQDVTTVEATSTDISDNLDLRAVASLFGVCDNLEDFERRLNDPESQLSNLDLNGDNEVDYLRVMEVSKNGTYVITIQAVIGKDLFQDVATIDVEKDQQGETKVQVVGDVYMYGPNYIIEPYYERPPVVYVYLWGPRYDPWYSPYYYGYYPTYYHPWNPYPTYYYIEHVHVHRSTTVTYTYVNHRNSSNAAALQQTQHRGDYQAKKPEQTFAARNSGMTNKQDLIVKREETSPTKVSGTSRQVEAKPAVKTVQQDWKPASGVNAEGTRVSVPTTKIASDPNAKPRIDLSKDPNPKPIGETYSKPASSPSAKPSVDPYGRQPVNNAPAPVKRDEYTKPVDVRTSQPQNQYSKPAVNPNATPANTQQRATPTPTTPQRETSTRSEQPTRQASPSQGETKIRTQTTVKQPMKSPPKTTIKSEEKKEETKGRSNP